MRDLSRFTGESFDLIFHPVSNNFVTQCAADMAWGLPRAAGRRRADGRLHESGCVCF